MSQGHPLQAAYAQHYPAEVARLLAGQGAGPAAAALDELPGSIAATVAARLPQSTLTAMLAGLDDDRIEAWLNTGSADQALSLLLHLDPGRRNALLARIGNRRMRRNLKTLLIYPRDSVGALVDPSAVRLIISIPLAEAIELLRTEHQAPNPSVWIVDEDGRYRGGFDATRALAATSPLSRLDEFVIEIPPLRAETTAANARGLGQWLEYSELPIVDAQHHFLGVLPRRRLMSGRTGSRSGRGAVPGAVGELVRQYFRILGALAGRLLSDRGTRP